MKTVHAFKEKKSSIESIGIFLSKIGGIMEVLFILFIWLLIFSGTKLLGEFTLEDMIAYLLIGNLIGMFTSYLLYKSIKFNIGKGDSKMFYYKPLEYLIRVIMRTSKKLVMPFFISISLNILLLYFLVDNIYFNYDLRLLVLIFIIIVLAFITELLLAFLLDIYVFWSFESNSLFKIVLRLKKIFSGAFFPLSIFGGSFLMFSLFLPFAYSFYVPTQLYLKKMSFEQGVFGLLVQLFWIGVLYFMVKFSWNKKSQKDKELLKRKSLLQEIDDFV